MWGDILRINSPTSSFHDTNYGSLRENTDPALRREVRLGEENTTVMEFKKAVGKEDFDRLVGNLKDITAKLKYTKLEFSIHDDTKRIMVKILNKSSDELIAEVPPEKFLDLIAELWKQAGLIVDKMV